MKFELDKSVVQTFVEWAAELILSREHPCSRLAKEMDRQLETPIDGSCEEYRSGEMRVFQVGPEEIDYDRFDFDWLVYWYETGSWEGHGCAAYKLDGKFGWANIGHCSCYGPEDQIGAPSMEIVSLVQDLTTTENDYDHEWMSAVLNKVVELEFVDWETAKKELGL